MVKQETLPMPVADEPQMIAFSASSAGGKIVPWLHVKGEWVRQDSIPAGDLVVIGFENDLLTIKRAADGDRRN